MEDEYMQLYEEHRVEYKITLIFESRHEIITYHKSLLYLYHKRSKTLPASLLSRLEHLSFKTALK